MQELSFAAPFAHNVRALSRCGIRIPSARTNTWLFYKDKYLEPMFGDVGQARTHARICRTTDCYNVKPQLYNTFC